MKYLNKKEFEKHNMFGTEKKIMLMPSTLLVTLT